MKVLIHVCCAPCLIGPLEALRMENAELRGFFYNPNIHPLLEFRKRVKALRVFLETDDLPLEIVEEYGLELFVRDIYDPDKRNRCRNCYRHRLHRTALRARELGFESFTTTMLVSLCQDHELIREVASEIAMTAGVAFFYKDFRPLSERSHELARQRQIYLQGYCGCCFSEYERYCDTERELYRGGSVKKGAK